MGKILASMLLGLLAASAVMAQDGAAAPGIAEVQALGRLNGEALACKQMALVDRIRSRIIYEAPKTREVGEAFEAATTARFLELGQQESNCTDARTMAERIEAATKALRAAFAETMGRKP
jgi:hypothetical protein